MTDRECKQLGFAAVVTFGIVLTVFAFVADSVALGWSAGGAIGGGIVGVWR